MTDEALLTRKRAVRARALRAAQVVAIVASLAGAGCSDPVVATTSDAGNNDAAVADLGSADTGVEDLGVADLGVVDAGLPDSAVVDLGSPDLSLVDAGLVDAEIADASLDLAIEVDLGETEVDAGFPCDDGEGGIDFECCAEMGFPPGCPVIGPFVPPSMNG